MGKAVEGAVIGAASVLFVRARTMRRKAQAAFGEATRAYEANEGPDALAAYLAHRLGCERAAVVGPDLRTRLETAGLDATLARRTADAMEASVAEQYGGKGAGNLDGLIADLDAAFERLLG